MAFRENLLHLRQEHNMTQEQLAMLLGVSRQAVTKWEAGKSMPEMDKLLKMAELFNCTLDELATGDLTQRAAEPGRVLAAPAANQDVVGYDDQMKSFAWKVALGVALILLAMIGGVWSAIYPLMLLVFFLGIAAGLLFIIPAAFSKSAFAHNHPYIANFYTDAQRQDIKKHAGIELAIGIAFIMLGMGCTGVLIGSDEIAISLFFVFLAPGVGLIVHAALLSGRTDIEDYNLDALSELTNEEVAGIVGEERAASVLARLQTHRKIGSACAIIMLIATIVGLLWLFLAPDAGEGNFWVSWIVGGILCAVAAIYLSAQAKK